MNEKQLYSYWKKYIAGNYLYRSVSNEYLTKIKKKGLTPGENPFEEMKKDLRGFFLIIENLSRKGHEIHIKWPFEVPSGTRVTRILRKDLSKNYIDLNSDKTHNRYYLKMRGGAMIFNLKALSKELLKKRSLLTKKQLKQIFIILKYCDRKAKYNSSFIRISRTSPYLEHAHFQHFGGRYWPSPLGSFDHFIKVISKEGLEKYKPFLSGKKIFYLRTFKDIPASEIEVMK